MSSALKSMVDKLSPLNLYRLEEESLVYKELAAFAEELDLLAYDIQELHNECFVSTAQTYGLERRERLWGAKQDQLSVQKRRDMIIARLSMNYNDFTLLSMEKCLQSLFMDATITEEPEAYRIYVNCGDTTYTKAQRNWFTKEINKFFPAHLEVFLDFRTINWKKIDEMSMSFLDMDACSYTWDQIEAYSI